MFEMFARLQLPSLGKSATKQNQPSWKSANESLAKVIGFGN
jgi:hypothetical protein